MQFKCVGCGEQVEEDATICKNCGRERPTSIRAFGMPLGPGIFVMALAVAAYTNGPIN